MGRVRLRGRVILASERGREVAVGGLLGTGVVGRARADRAVRGRAGGRRRALRETGRDTAVRVAASADGKGRRGREGEKEEEEGDEMEVEREKAQSRQAETSRARAAARGRARAGGRAGAQARRAPTHLICCCCLTEAE